MTLLKKKGIAVLKGVDVVHKLTGDGAANLGVSGSSLILSGTVYTERDPLALRLTWTGQDVQLYGVTEPNSLMAETATNHTASYNTASGQVSLATSASDSILVSLQDGSSLLISAVDSINTAFETDHSTQTSTNQSALDSHTTVFDGHVSTQNSLISALETELSDLKDDANIDTIAEVESLILSAAAAQSGSLLTKVGEFNTQISAEISTQLSADIQVKAELDQSGSTDFNTQHSTLLSMISSEFSSQSSAFVSYQNNELSTKASLATLINSADDSLSSMLSVETSARISADTSLSTRISAALLNVNTATGSFNPLISAEESIQEQARGDSEDQISVAKAAGNTDVLRGADNVVGSVAEEASLRVAAYADAATEISVQYSTAHSAADSVHGVLTGALDDAISSRASAFTALSGTINTELSGTRVAHISNLSAQLSAEIVAEGSDVGNTETSLSTQQSRLSELQDAGVDLDTFSEIVSLVSELSSSNSGTLASTVSTTVADLTSLTDHRISADNSLKAYLTGTVTTNRGDANSGDISSMASLISNAESEFSTMESAHTSYLVVADASLSTAVSSWEATTLSVALSNMVSSRISGDTVLSGNISSLASLRQDLADDEEGLRIAGDDDLDARLDDLESAWDGDTLTLTGLVSIAGNLEVTGELKLGVHTTVPAAYTSGSQATNNGALFYLDAADDANRTGFEKGNSWYFCEDGVWFASPFDNE